MEGHSEICNFRCTKRTPHFSSFAIALRRITSRLTNESEKANYGNKQSAAR